MQFAIGVERLTRAHGNADRVAPFRWYIMGLLTAGGGECVEPAPVRLHPDHTVAEQRRRFDLPVTSRTRSIRRAGTSSSPSLKRRCDARAALRLSRAAKLTPDFCDALGLNECFTRCHNHILMLFSLAIGSLAWATTPSYADTNRGLNEALADLRSSDAEWRQNDVEFRSLRESGEISEVAVEEFAGFVAELHRKMLENCHTFRKHGGDPESLGFDCDLPNETLASRQELPQSAMTVQTEEEKTASLEATLTKSLGDFDETLQKRQKELRDLQNGQSLGGYAPNQNVGGAGGGNRSSGTTSTALRQTEPGAGPGVMKKVQGPIPRNNTGGDVGAGNDDSVVARQLREAAESEQDPVLKDKLWAEYRKFRASEVNPN